jgi:hypothetical protein
MSQFIDSMHFHRSHRLVGPSVTVPSPSWNDVENAIRQLDGRAYTAVELHRSGDEPSETFLVTGGAGRWYLGDSVLRWQFEGGNGGEESVVIWAEMDFECKLRNLLTDEEKVLRIAKRFYETGSYEDLDEVE